MRDNRRALAVVVAVSLLATAACNQVLGPTPRDSNWHATESTHFVLNARPGSFADENATVLGAVLDDQYQVTLQRLDARYSGRIEAFLYNSGNDAGLPGDHSGTAFADTNTFEAVVVPPLDGNAMSVVSHEANHVIIINAWGHPGTSFVSEGLASALLSERYHSIGAHFYYRWTKSHRAQIPSIATLADDGQWSKANSDIAYSASASFLAYLLDTDGPAKLQQLFHARSGEFGARFAQIYGRQLAVAEGEWLAFCDRQ